jgi:hypothetical protein
MFDAAAVAISNENGSKENGPKENGADGSLPRPAVNPFLFRQ